MVTGLLLVSVAMLLLGSRIKNYCIIQDRL